LSKVAVVEFNADQREALKQALSLIGGIDDVNATERPVTLKVGIYHTRSPQHTSAEFVNAIIESFDRAQKIFLVESDNYCGKGLERLEVYEEFFSDRVVPFSLSGDADSENVRLAGMDMQLSPILFKPNVLVDTHVMRTMKRGSILKNLFGCVPDAKKSKFHKTEMFCPMLADVFEAVGGIDLAVLDGTRLFRTGDRLNVQTNTLIVGRDAVAVETVGSFLAGVKPEKNPVIQEFVKRGLGEGSMENIEVVGAPLEDVKRRFKLAVKTLEKMWREKGGAPKSWSSQIDNLIKEGFFNPPKKRTREEVAKALEARGVRVKGNTGVMVTTLNRKVKKEKLKTEKRPDGWVYWTK
jgi:uncharacterized protein (DUF362 family)